MRLNKYNLEGLKDIERALEYLKILEISEREKNIIISFLRELLFVKWGWNIATQMPGKCLAKYGIKNILRVDNYQKASILIRRTRNSARVDEEYELLLSRPSGKYSFELADDVITRFGADGYEHGFWPWVSTDIRGVLAERLMGMSGVYSMRWEIYRRGHYFVGYRTGKTIFVF